MQMRMCAAPFMIPLLCAVGGFFLFLAIGRGLDVSYGGHTVPVEVILAALGVILGYMIGAGLAPKPDPAPVQKQTPKAKAR